MVQDFGATATKVLFETVANMTLPRTEAECTTQGFPVLRPAHNDFLLVRSKYGTGEESDDILKAWTNDRQVERTFCTHLSNVYHRSSYTTQEVAKLSALRERMLGPADQMTEVKAARDDSGIYVGGIALERSHRAECVKKAPRSYNFGTTWQQSRNLDAPSKNMKASDTGVDEALELRKDILKAGADCGLRGMHKAGPRLTEEMENRARVVNYIRAGAHGNVFWTACQVNAAAGAEAESDVVLKDSIGEFGCPHADCGDHCVVPSAMTNFTKPHPDVDPEVFCVLDHGVAFVVEEFETLYFCGLHFHGGTQPMYKSPRTDDSIYYRLTLIMYPPAVMLNGQSSSAFAAMPVLEQTPMLRIPTEWKNPETRGPSFRAKCGQATYLRDGGSLMEQRDHFDHFARNAMLVVDSLFSQLPEEYAARYDKAKFLEAFTHVQDGERMAATPWEEGPGWSGRAVALGPVSTEPEEVTLYGNEELSSQNSRFFTFGERVAQTVPLMQVARSGEEGEDGFIGGYSTRYRVKIANARKETDNEPGVDSGDESRVNPGKVKQKRKRKRGRGSEEEGDSGEEGEPPAKKAKEDTNVPRMKFLQALSPVNLCSAQEALARVKPVPEEDPADESMCGEMESILSERISLDSSDGHFSVITALSAYCKASEEGTAIRGASLRTRRRDSMLANLLLWESMEQAIDLCSRRPQPTALGRIVTQVTEYLACRPGALRLRAPVSDFPDLSEDKRDFVRYDKKPPPYSQTVAALVMEVLEQWAHVPNKAVYRPQARLVRHLLGVGGWAILLVPGVWEGVTLVAKIVAGTGASKLVTAGMVDEWAMKEMRVLSFSDDSRKHLDDIVAAHQRLAGGDQSGGGRIGRLMARLRIPAWPLDDGRTFEDRVQEQRAPFVGASHAGASEGTGPTLQTENLKKFLFKLEMLYPLLDIPSDAWQKNSAYTNGHKMFLRHVYKSLDKKSPWRDLAPSRTRILADGGPFDLAHVATPGGLFSALVYRGITHNTPFLKDVQSPILFRDNEAWHEMYNKEWERNPCTSYYCSGSAIGQHCKARSVVHVDAYWKATEHPKMVKWVSSEAAIDFYELYAFFKTLPAFGTLTAYLLASDYAICGRATTPSWTIFAKVLKDIDAGGLKGLRRLVDLHDDDSDQQLGLALSIVDKEMRLRIPGDRLASMRYSMFVLEHSLCKEIRLDVRAFTNLWEERLVAVP